MPRLPANVRHALDQPVMGLGDVAVAFAISMQLAQKWTKWADWPEPYATLVRGPVWETSKVLAVTKAHERKPGQGPRPGGDPRPPSVARRRTRATEGKAAA